MEKHLDPRVSRHFEGLEDPRTGNALRHPLLSIVTIAVLAVICGADNWVEIENFGLAKYAWLGQFLALPHGIPSHDTFGRLFAALDADQFELCFRSWMEAIAELFKGQVIAIDGKTVRRSHDRHVGRRAIHMVSAWATANHLVLGQEKTEDHSNEITAIPKLLKAFAIKDCVVTIDAMGCQKKVAKQIIGQGGDYILALKPNQGLLHQRVQKLFSYALTQGKLKHENHGLARTIGKDHGRLEERRCWTLPTAEWRHYLDIKDKWSGLQSVIMVWAKRTLNGQTSTESRYYISSLPPDAELLLHAVRTHWGVENSLHWVLDIAFREDESRVRKGNGQHNLTILRRLALNLLRKADSVKGGIAARRKRAGWDHDYLLKVLCP